MAARPLSNNAQHALTVLNERNRLDALDSAELLGMDLAPVVRRYVLRIFVRNIDALGFGYLAQSEKFALADALLMECAAQARAKAQLGENQ